MEYTYICPNCGKIEIFKSRKTVERKINEKALCNNCKAKIRQASEQYIRNCPNCGKEIQYRYKSDYTKANKNNSFCKSCATANSNTQFKKGHRLNDIYAIRVNSLDKLIEDESLQTFYWIGFLLADGCFYNKYRFEFVLKDSDKNVLEEFGKYINYVGEIKHRSNTNSNRIYFSNAISIPRFMAKFGFNFKKTYNPNNFDYFRKYSKEQLTALLIGIIDGDGSITKNGSTFSNQINITAYKDWESFYHELFKLLEIDWNCCFKNTNIDYDNADIKVNTICIRIYKREYCLKLKQFILNNNLFYLQRKWNRIIEDLSALER